MAAFFPPRTRVFHGNPCQNVYFYSRRKKGRIVRPGGISREFAFSAGRQARGERAKVRDGRSGTDDFLFSASEEEELISSAPPKEERRKKPGDAAMNRRTLSFKGF